MDQDTEKTADQLSAVLADLADVVDGIGADQAHAPTPCTEMDVAALRAHVLGWLDTFAGGFADPEGRAPRAGLDDWEPVDVGGAAVRGPAARLDAGLRAGGAERPLRLGESAMPGDLALGMVLWEYQVHGWDLARATGQQWSPPEDATEASAAFAPMMLTPDYQGEGKAFAPRVEVPDDAPALDRLLGLSGRDPRWTPPAG